MKKTAFFQACIIVVLLLLSWMLLFNKLKKPDSEALPIEPGPSADQEQDVGLADATITVDDAAPQTIPDPEPQVGVPEGWQEWFTYLEEVGSPNEMRSALEALKDALLTLPREEAIARLLEFIESEADMKTGLAFQPGPGKELRGASSLRAVFLDWLYQLDPQVAARVAERELDSRGTGLDPDVFVIHLRNFALGSDLPESTVRSTVGTHFAELMQHQPWIENPESAIAEAMDVAVYLESTEFVPGLARLMQPGQATLLRRAASLGLERLVDRRPLDVLPILVDPEDQESVPAVVRASYMARLDPRLPGAKPLIEDYVRSPGRDPNEVRFFLESFPNLNQSRSHNLISTDFSNTEPGGYIGHLEEALELVRTWQEDAGLADFNPLLREVEERLELQLGVNP